MRIHEPNRRKRGSSGCRRESLCYHKFQCLDIDRGTFMSHSSIETWAVWSCLSYSYSVPISRSTIFISKTNITITPALHTSHPFIHHITLDVEVNMSYPLHHTSSSSLAMTTPSPPTRSGSESILLDLPNSGTRCTMPKTRSPLSPSPYMDIVRVVFIFSSFFPLPPCLSMVDPSQSTRPGLTYRDVHRDMDPRRVRSNQMQQAYHLRQVVLVKRNDSARMQTCGMLASMD